MKILQSPLILIPPRKVHPFINFLQLGRCLGLILSVNTIAISTLCAADISSTWNGGTGNWSDPANWTPNTFYPNNGEGGFTFDASLSSGTSTLTHPISIQGFALSGGTLIGDGSLEINGLFNWTGGGTLGAGTGPIILTGGASISGSDGNRNLQGRTLINSLESEFVWDLQGGWDIATGQGSLLQNQGVINIIRDFEYRNSFGGDSSILNQGTFLKSAGTGTMSFLVPFENQGFVEVQSGTIAFTQGITSFGIFYTDGGTVLQLSGGTHSMLPGSILDGPGTVRVSSGTVNFHEGIGISPGIFHQTGGNTIFHQPTGLNTVQLNGGSWGGDGSVTIIGLFNWSGGSTLGAGAGPIVLTGGASISGSGGNRNLQGRTLINSEGSEFVWDLQGGWDIATGQGSLLQNQGVINITQDFEYRNSFDGESSILNQGTFLKSAGTGTMSFLVPFENQGTVEVQSGTIAFDSGYQQTDGDLRLASGSIRANAPLEIESGRVTGAGLVTAAVNLGGTISPGADSSAGLLTINGNVSSTSSSSLEFSIGGPSAGVGHDALLVNGTLALDGRMEILLLNGFAPLGGDNYVVVEATTLTGSFSDVGNGQRISTLDGSGTFLVHYGVDSPFPPNQIVVSGFLPCQTPVIEVEPAGQSVCPNTEVILEVSATGSNLTYQWLLNGEVLEGETQTQLVLPAVQISQNGGNYQVRVQNSCGIELSQIAILSVLNNPPTLTLNGPASIILESCVDAFVDPGASAVDDCDNTVTVTNNGHLVNTNIPGTYIVTYQATDSGSNTSSVNRTVFVRDTAAPIFSQVPEDLEVACSNENKDIIIQQWLSQAQATDTCGTTTVINNLGHLGNCAEGVRTVTWTANDGHGNSATVSRTLTLVADGRLSQLVAAPTQISVTLLTDLQQEETLQLTNEGTCPIKIEQGWVSGPDNGPEVALTGVVFPLVICPGQTLTWNLNIDTTDMVPGIDPYQYLLNLAGFEDDSLSISIEVKVVEGSLPDLTPARRGGEGLSATPASGPGLPDENESFTLRAMISNVGIGDATSFTVGFWEGNSRLGTQEVSALLAGEDTILEMEVDGRISGFYLFSVKVESPEEGEVTLVNNDTSLVVQVGSLPIGDAQLVVIPRAVPECGIPDSVFIAGIAYYEFVSLNGTVRYNAKGAKVTFELPNGTAIDAGHTLVNGTFSGYVPTSAAGDYSVLVTVTDATLTRTEEVAFTLPASECEAGGGDPGNPGNPNPNYPPVTRNLYICNEDFVFFPNDSNDPMTPTNLVVGNEIRVGVHVHYFEINGNKIPEQPVTLTILNQIDGKTEFVSTHISAVSFQGGGVDTAFFDWTPPYPGTFILHARLDPTFAQLTSDDNATRTVITLGGQDDTTTLIQVQTTDNNLCSPYPSLSGRAVYYVAANDPDLQPGELPPPSLNEFPVICGEVAVSVFGILDPNQQNDWILLGSDTARTDRLGNFRVAPFRHLPPGYVDYKYEVEVTDGTLIGRDEDTFLCPPPQPGQPSDDTPLEDDKDVFVYSEDIGFLGQDCESPLLRWPLPGEEISIAATIHYFGSLPEPLLPVEVSVLLPVGNDLIRQEIGSVEISDWSLGGQICLPWTPSVLGPQIIEVQTLPNLVPLNQFQGNDAATRLIFVGEVDCQLMLSPDSSTLEVGQTTTVSLGASKVSGDTGNAMNLSVVYAGEGEAPAGLEVILSMESILFSETIDVTIQTTPDVLPGLYRFIIVGSNDTCQALTTLAVRVLTPAVNHPPSIDPVSDQLIQENEALGPLAIEVSDQDGDDLTVTATSSNSNLVPLNNITVEKVNEDWTVTINPLPNQFGVTVIGLMVSDGEESAETSFELTVNGQPRPGEDVVGAKQDRPSRINARKLLANDQDPEGDSMVVSSVEPTSDMGGTLDLLQGVITYTPPQGFFGTDTFHYEVSDSRGGHALGRVALTVSERNIPGQPGVLHIQETGVQIEFNGIPSFLYRILYADEVGGEWQDLSGPIAADPQGNIQFFDGALPRPPFRIYRLEPAI